MQKNHNGTMNKDAGKLLKKNIPLTLLQGMRVRGSWRSNKDCNIVTSPAPPDIAVCRSRSPDAQPEARGINFLLAFFTTSCHQRVSKTNGGLDGSCCWVVAFPSTSCLQLVLTPTRWLPVLTELYNSSIAHSITHSIFGMACLIVIKRK